MNVFSFVDERQGASAVSVSGREILTAYRQVAQPAQRITNPGSLSGADLRVGRSLSITPGTVAPVGGGQMTYETRWVVASEVVATSASYEARPADDWETWVAQWRGVEVGGTAPGPSAWVTVGFGTVRYPTPVFTVQPSFARDPWAVGEVVEFSLGEAPGAGLTVDLFRLGTSDRTAEVVGATEWDSAGEFEAPLSLRARATNSGGSVQSDLVTATLRFVGPIVSGAGSITGDAYVTGVERIITPGNASPRGGGSVSIAYRHTVGGAVVSTAAAFTPAEGQVGQQAVSQWQAVEVGGTRPGASAWFTVADGLVALPPPAPAWVFAGDFDGTIEAIPPTPPAWQFAGDFDGTIIAIPEAQ